MPAKRSRTPMAATYAVAIAAFAGTAGLLASRVHAGADPAIGSGPATAAASPRVIVTRQIRRRTIITTRVVRRPLEVGPASRQPAGAAAGARSGPAAVEARAPAATPAPAVAPAPAAAPAPTPTPTPVTRAS